MATTTKDTILRFLIEADGDAELKALVKEITDIGTAADGSEGKVAGFINELSESKKVQQTIQDYRDLRTKVIETTSEYVHAREQVRALAEEMSKSDAPTKKQTSEFEKAKASLERLGQAQASQRTQLHQAQAAIEATGGSVRNLAAAETLLKNRADVAAQSIRNLATSTRESMAQQAALAARLKDGDESFRRMATASRTSADALAAYRNRAREAATENAALTASSGLAGRAMSGFRTVVGGLVGFLTLRSAAEGVKHVLELGDAAQRAQKQLSGLYGSDSLGTAAFNGLKTVARDNALAFTDVLQSAKKLKAFGLEPLDGTLQSLIDQNARLGGSNEDLTGIILATGQAWSKQKLQGEEILQLVERGVPVWDLLQRATGKNVQELQKLSTAGKLGRDVIKQLLEQMGKETAGAAAANLDTLSGRFTVLKDRANQFFLEIANSGALDYFKTRVTELIASIDQSVKDGSFQEFATKISNAIIGTAKAIEGTIQFVYDYATALKALAAAYLTVKAASFLSDMTRVRASLIQTTVATQGLEAATLASGQGVSKLGGLMAAIPRVLKFSVLGIALDFTISQVFRLIEAINYYQDAQSKLAIGNANLASLQVDITKKIAETKALYKSYADQAVVSSDQLTTATRDQLEAFKFTTEGAIKYYRALKLEATRAGDDLALASAQEHLKQLDATLVAIKDRITAVIVETDKASTRFGEFSTKAAEAFDQVIAKGDSVKQAVSGIFDKLDLTDSAGIKNAVETMTQVGARGAEAAKRVETEFRASLAKLSAEDFEAFKAKAKDTFEAGSEGAKVLQNSIDKISFDKLGIDIDAIKTGFTDAGRVAVDSFSDVVAKVDSLGFTAQQKATVIAQAFDKAFSQATTKAEVEALRQKLIEAFNDGNITAAEFQARIAQVQQKLAELGPTGAAATKQVADGADSAGSSLDRMASSADKAASSTENLGEASDGASDGINKTSDAAKNASFSMGSMSQKAGEALVALNKYAAFQDIWRNNVNAVMGQVREQKTAVQDATKALDDQLAALDPLSDKLKTLKLQYDYVDDESLRALAQKQQQLEEQQKQADTERARAEEEQKRLREQQLQSQQRTNQDKTLAPVDKSPVSSVTTSDGGKSLGTFKIEVVAGTTGVSISDATLLSIAKRLAPLILREVQLSQKTRG